MKIETNETTHSKKTSYLDAGVNRVLADKLVDRIKNITSQKCDGKKTTTPSRTAIGGYASLYEISKTQWLAASTDGVGTKLKLAFELGKHDTVGIDLVAMSVNDLLCVGAKPLFFLDYFATGKLDLDTSTSVIEGIQKGCEMAGAMLVGGETAEMPGFYSPGEYDLAGFAVGLVHPKKALPYRRGENAVKAGDLLIGLRSSGFHSNGFSLIRKMSEGFVPKKSELAWAKTREDLLEELLTPTTIYSDALLPAITKNLYTGLSHITGSGFLNLPRISDALSYSIELPSLSKLPRSLQWLHSTGALDEREWLTTFNCGIGMIGSVRAKNARKAVAMAQKAGVEAEIIGEVIPKNRKDGCIINVKAWNQTHTLQYDET